MLAEKLSSFPTMKEMWMILCKAPLHNTHYWSSIFILQVDPIMFLDVHVTPLLPFFGIFFFSLLDKYDVKIISATLT